MFIETDKSGNLGLFNQSRYVYLGIVGGVHDITIEINDKEARDYKEEKDFHIYYNKKESKIIIVTPQKQKEMQESDYKDPDLVYVGR